MNTKEKNRVYKYKNSNGLARAWHYIVIALTMGNVDSAVERYDREQSLGELATSGAGGCGTVIRASDGVTRPYKRPTLDRFRNKRREPVLRVDEDEEDENIDLLTAAILAQHINDNPETQVEPAEDKWGGFGGGGDFGGGGAGGDWSPTGTTESNVTPTLGSDSY